MGAIDDVLEFWFGPKDAPDFGEMRAIWFRSTQAFDAEFEARFADAHRRAGAGELDDWMASPAGCLALIVLLDQYPRNVFRGTARAYATDATARAVAKHALEKGFERGLNGVERISFSMSRSSTARTATTRPARWPCSTLSAWRRRPARRRSTSRPLPGSAASRTGTPPWGARARPRSGHI